MGGDISYWAEYPELYTEIIFKEMVKRGLCNDLDNPEEAVNSFKDDPLFYMVCEEAERDYWADRIDGAKEGGVRWHFS